ncbi:hypothetical protein [Umezawaea sp.]|uniref:hypothetical protein n=1 Tax=Umezawaea sp. TaxID=1955258 RepID=UPI002ED5B30C
MVKDARGEDAEHPSDAGPAWRERSGFGDLHVLVADADRAVRESPGRALELVEYRVVGSTAACGSRPAPVGIP